MPAPDKVDHAYLQEHARPARTFLTYEDFSVGLTIEHGLSRTVTESDNLLFTMLTLHYNRSYFDADYAAAIGKGGVVVNPYLLFLLVFGMSVEDLSEGGGGGRGGFLGVDDLRFGRDVTYGETVTARSEVIVKRPSSSKPGVGIVGWRTTGLVGDGEQIVQYTRSNLLTIAPAEPGLAAS